MSRRGGRNQSELRRDQPSPAEPAGRGRGGTSVRVSPSAHAPSYAPLAPAPLYAPSPAPVFSSPRVIAVVASSSSAPPPAVSSSAAPYPASASKALSAEVEQRLILQSPAPSSSKAVRFPDQPGYGTIGRKIQVRVNHFQMQVAEHDLHHYDVSIAPEVTSKKINRGVMKRLVQLHQETHLGKHIPAYDGRKSLFTAGPLPFSLKDFVVKLVDNDEQASSSGSPRVKREREFKVTIRYASKPDLHHLQRFIKCLQLDNPQETLQVLDVVLRASPSEKYNVVGRSYFSPNLGKTSSLGNGTEY